MRVQKILISNVLGVEHMEIVPGALTSLEGGNGVGKTSVLEAVKGALGGGSDATLLRQGATEGQVVLLLDDGTEISRRFTAEGAKPVSVRDPKLGKISRAQTYLDRIADALAVNPIAFLTAPPAKRAEWLLEAMPINVTEEELRAAAGPHARLVLSQGLESIQRTREAVFNARTGVNRSLKDKRAAADQLRATLPPEEQPCEDVRALRTQRDDLAEEKARKVQEISKATDEAVHTVDVWLAEEISKLKAEAQRLVDDHRARGRKHLDEIAAEYGPKMEALAGRLATAEERARQRAQTERTREFVATSDAEATKLEQEANELTAALERVDALRAAKLAALPIPQVEVREGQVFVEGIPFDRLNKAKQVKLALNVARLRAGELGLVCVDGLECLDAETFAAFEKAAVRSGLQLVVNRVTSGPLTVRTLPAEQEAVA